MARMNISLTQGLLAYYLSSVVLLACIILLNHRVFTTISPPHNPVQDESQTSPFVDEEGCPIVLIPPSRHPRNVALIIEESVHYAPNSTLEWQSLIPSGTGGTVRLGADKRLFTVSMFHQLQCLDELQQAVVRVQGVDSEPARQHAHHCLNYIRQMLLCAASVRLEPVKPTKGGRGADGFWLEHRCRDWSLLRREVEHNHELWQMEHRSEAEVS